MTAIRMENKILPIWRITVLSCLLALTTNCAAQPDEKDSAEVGEKAEQTVAKIYDLETREQAAELYNAIVANDIAKVKAALEKGLKPEERYLRNLSAMDVAADAGRPEAMDLLIRSGGDPNHKNKKNIPLLAMVLDNHYRWDKKRIEKLKKDNNLAMSPDSKGVAYVLLQHGADPNAAFPMGEGDWQPVLSYAAQYDDLEMVKRLVELGADVNAPKNSIFAPLFYAAREGHVEVARFLVEHGVDLEAKDISSEATPIRSAASNSVDVALLFLEKGVNPEKFIPYYLSLTKDLPRKDRHRLVKALIDKGLNVREQQLFSVISDKDLLTIKMLVEAGAALCLRDYFGRTAYEDAKKNNHQEIAGYLASKGGANCP